MKTQNWITEVPVGTVLFFVHQKSFKLENKCLILVEKKYELVFLKLYRYRYGLTLGLSENRSSTNSSEISSSSSRASLHE